MLATATSYSSSGFDSTFVIPSKWEVKPPLTNSALRPVSLVRLRGQDLAGQVHDAVFEQRVTDRGERVVVDVVEVHASDAGTGGAGGPLDGEHAIGDGHGHPRVLAPDDGPVPCMPERQQLTEC